MVPYCWYRNPNLPCCEPAIPSLMAVFEIDLEAYLFCLFFCRLFQFVSIPRPASTPESAAAVVIAVVSSDARLLLPTTPSCDHGFIFGYLLDAVAETRSRSVARAAATFGPMFPHGDDGEPLLFSSLAAEPTGSFGGYRLARIIAVFADVPEPPVGARLFFFSR